MRAAHCHRQLWRGHGTCSPNPQWLVQTCMSVSLVSDTALQLMLPCVSMDNQQHSDCWQWIKSPSYGFNSVMHTIKESWYRAQWKHRWQHTLCRSNKQLLHCEVQLKTGTTYVTVSRWSIGSAHFRDFPWGLSTAIIIGPLKWTPVSRLAALSKGCGWLVSGVWGGFEKLQWLTRGQDLRGHPQPCLGCVCLDGPGRLFLWGCPLPILLRYSVHQHEKDQDQIIWTLS